MTQVDLDVAIASYRANQEDIEELTRRANHANDCLILATERYDALVKELKAAQKRAPELIKVINEASRVGKFKAGDRIRVREVIEPIYIQGEYFARIIDPDGLCVQAEGHDKTHSLHEQDIVEIANEPQ